MKILATFDGSVFSESIVPQLRVLCGVPAAEVILLRVAEMPGGQGSGVPSAPVAATPGSTGGTALVVEPAAPGVVETKEQAVERVKAELAGYLRDVARQLPEDIPCRTETMLDSDVRSAIVRFAMEEKPDLIVMATHGRTGLVHLLCGDVAESVLRSSVAPVLLVHPQAVSKSRQESGGGEPLRPPTAVR
jgi:nucleotide-binding universal stress UspA family protein